MCLSNLESDPYLLPKCSKLSVDLSVPSSVTKCRFILCWYTLVSGHAGIFSWLWTFLPLSELLLQAPISPYLHWSGLSYHSGLSSRPPRTSFPQLSNPNSTPQSYTGKTLLHFIYKAHYLKWSHIVVYEFVCLPY